MLQVGATGKEEKEEEYHVKYSLDTEKRAVK
jgi:hypothetical protein